MSDKLISADKMIAILEDIQDVVKAVTVENVIYNLKIAPAVDAVEVVRCGKCKYYFRPEDECNGFCMHDNGLCGFVKEDYYCPYGERRDEDAVDRCRCSKKNT